MLHLYLKYTEQLATLIKKRLKIYQNSNRLFYASKERCTDGRRAHNLRDILRYQAVDLPMEYATQVLDKNQTGLITIQQISKDAVLMHLLSVLRFAYFFVYQ